MGANLSDLVTDKDVVIGIQDIPTIIEKQKNHGEWIDPMKECLVGPCKLLMDNGSDATVIGPSGNMYRLNSELLVKYNSVKKHTVGSVVQLIEDEDEFKLFQAHHGEWNEDMKCILGATVEITRIFEDGDYKIKYNDKTFIIHPKTIISEKDEKPSNERDKEAKTGSKVLVPGARVRLIKDKSRFKRLQEGHGGWVSFMKHILGEKGKVKSIFPDGDVKVKVLNAKMKLNPKCVEATDSDSDSDTGFMQFMKQMTKMAVNDSDDSDEEVLTMNNNTTKFYFALKTGNLSQVEKMVDSIGVETDLNGIYPLLIAVNEGHEDLVDLLLERKANINITDKDGDTALHLAVQKNRFRLCELLIKKGADVNVQNDKKITPIMLAAWSGSHDILKLLISTSNADLSIGDSDRDTALHLAVAKSKIESVEILLNAGADMYLLNKKLFNSYHLAALRGHEKILEIFLKKEGEKIVNSQKEDKVAAIHLAVLNNHENCLRLLIKYNADINIRSDDLQTALHMAVMRKHLKCVKVLVENKADLDVKDEDGDTPLHVAMKVNQTKGIGRLIGISSLFGIAGKIPDESDKPEDIVVYLIENGASTDIKNKNGETPLDICKDNSLKKRILDLVEGKYSKQHVIARELTQASVHVPVEHIATSAVEHPVESSFAKSNETELMELRQKLLEIEDKKTCKICHDRQSKVVFGCGHMSCDECSQAISMCHVCSEIISTKIKIN